MALVVAAVAWGIGLALILRQRLFVTNDSLSNYAHVWYLSDRLWHGHTLPFHMPSLEHGDAFAVPYGFLPWMSAAVVRPLFGDWTVTLWLVLGFVLLVSAQWWAFPELRGGWRTAALLAEPALVESVLLAQLPFLWAAAMVFAAIALWRRERWLAAGIVLGLAQATHPAVILPIAGLLVAARLCREQDRWRLLRAYALSLLVAAPAAAIVLMSPVVAESTDAQLVGNFLATVSLRGVVIAAPFILLALQRTPLARAPLAIFALLIALNAALVPARHNEFAWAGLVRTPDTSLAAFVDSPAFQAGATYRLLRVGDGKVGMYEILRGGGKLDAEFFPESIDRRSWDDASSYTAFLVARHVDYVVIYNAYDARYRTNEHELLASMSQDPTAAQGAGVCTALEQHRPQYDVYRISACASVRAAP
ncbi:MAG: hypothetical protein IVW36_01295 [Dehalococcoidia bacterium]|nr:hypothetical protein [Dehalococcoidia bacterium]